MAGKKGKKNATQRTRGGGKKKTGRAGAREKSAKGGDKMEIREITTSAGRIVDMEEAIKMLKTTRTTFYRWLRAGRFKGMKVGRQWRFERDEIERFMRGDEPVIDLPVGIQPLIDTLAGEIEKHGGEYTGDLSEPTARHAVELMLVLGEAMKCSDVHMTAHLEPNSSTPRVVLRYRIDGVLKEVTDVDARLAAPLVEQWKRMARCDINEKVKPQDGRIPLKMSEISDRDKTIDLRVSFLPTGLGEEVTARLLDASGIKLDLAEFGFHEDDLDTIYGALKEPWGTIIVTGPTGSGKTTTLYAMLNRLASPELKTMTIEDPVEYYLPWVTQVQVRKGEGIDFKTAIRHELRSDPDVLMVSEIRDSDTLKMCQAAALTGHLVLTAMHANTAVSVIERMATLDANPSLVADSLKLIVAQRLVRKVCPHCSEEYTPDDDVLEMTAEGTRAGGLDWDSLPRKFRRAVGCKECSFTGYRGRKVIAEVLEVSPELMRAIRRSADADELHDIAVGQGMTSIAADGLRSAALGETTVEEALRVTGTA